MNVIDWLKLPELKGIKDLDDLSATLVHSQIISGKGFLNKIYLGYYAEFKKIINSLQGRLFVELGSGGGFIKQVIPGVITSDVMALRGIDLCFSGENLPFKDNTVDGFFMLNVLHHIRKPKSLLRELNRVLKAGGRVFMIEPANTVWSKFIYSKFHHEDFNELAGWNLEGTGRLSSANDAMPWIIFMRDRLAFETEFSELKINTIRLHTPLRYLISGGVSLRQLLPPWTYRIIEGLEYILSPLNRYIGMFMTVELERTWNNG
jgi:SAM-dependent methyltransferase